VRWCFRDQLTSAFGWRGAYLTLALIVAGTILPVAVVFFRNRPELYGLMPDLDVEPELRAVPEPAFTRSQALQTGVFWLLNAASFLSNGIGTGLLLHHFAIMGSEGFSRSQALAVLTPLALTQAVATLGTGMLLDRWQPRRVLPLSMLSLAAGCALAQYMAAAGTGMLYGVAIGASLGCFHAINASAYAHYFGRKHLGEIRGISFVTGVMGAACGPIPFAIQNPTPGGYGLVLTLSALACVSVAIASYLVRDPANKSTL
jgi:MFS family permease